MAQPGMFATNSAVPFLPSNSYTQTFSRGPHVSFSNGTSPLPLSVGTMEMNRGNQVPATTKAYDGQWMTVPNLPYAMANRALVFPTAIQFMVLTKDNFLIQTISPMKQTDEINFKFDRYEFVPTIAGIYPERTAPKLLHARRVQGAGSMARRGIGMYFTVDFANSPEGRAYIVNQLTQMAESVKETLCFDVLQRLMVTPNYVYAAEDRAGVYNDQALTEKIQWEFLTWDIIKKLKSPLGDLDTFIEQKMSAYGGIANAYIMDSRQSVYVTTFIPELRDYSKAGPAGPQLRKDGVAGIGQVTPNGATIYTVSSFDIEERNSTESILNPLERSVQKGTYGIAYDINRGNYANLPEYSSKMRDVQMFHNGKGKFEKITLASMFQNQNRIDPVTGRFIDLGSSSLKYNGMLDTPEKMVTDKSRARDPFHYQSHATGKWHPIEFLGQMDCGDSKIGRKGNLEALDYIDMAHATVSKLTEFKASGNSAHGQGGRREEVINAFGGLVKVLVETSQVPWNKDAEEFMQNVVAANETTPIVSSSEAGVGKGGGVSLFDVLEYRLNEVGFVEIPPRGGKTYSAVLPPFCQTVGGLRAIARAHRRLPANEKVETYYGFSTDAFTRVAQAVDCLEFVVEKMLKFAKNAAFLDPAGCPSWLKADPSAAFVANLLNYGHNPIFVRVKDVKRGGIKDIVKNLPGYQAGTKKAEEGGEGADANAPLDTGVAETVTILLQSGDTYASSIASRIAELTSAYASDATAAEPLGKAVSRIAQIVGAGFSSDSPTRGPGTSDEDYIRAWKKHIDDVTKRSVVVYIIMRLLNVMPKTLTAATAVARLDAIGEAFSGLLDKGEPQPAFKKANAAIERLHKFFDTKIGEAFVNKSNAKLREEVPEQALRIIGNGEIAKKEVSEHSSKAEKLATKSKQAAKSDEAKGSNWIRTPFCYSPKQLADFIQFLEVLGDGQVLTAFPSSFGNPAVIATEAEFASFGAHVFHQSVGDAEKYTSANSNFVPTALIGTRQGHGNIHLTGIVGTSMRHNAKEAAAPAVKDSSSSSSSRKGMSGLSGAAGAAPVQQFIGANNGGKKRSLHSGGTETPVNYSGSENASLRPVKRAYIPNVTGFSRIFDIGSFWKDVKGNFERTFAAIAEETTVDIVRCLAQVYASLPATWDSLYNLIATDVPFPFNFLLMRPHERWRSVTTTKVATDGQTMTTYYGRTTWMEGSDPKIQTRFGSLFWHSCPLMTNPKNVFHVPNTMIVKYEGGSGTEFYKPEAYAPESNIYGPKGDEGSVFVFMVPKTFEDYPNTPMNGISVTGNLYHVRKFSGDGEEHQYPGDDFQARYWGFRDKKLGRLSFGGQIHHQGSVTIGSVCYPDHIMYYDAHRQGFYAYRPSNGHWDSRYIYAGCQTVREGHGTFDVQAWSSSGFQQL